MVRLSKIQIHPALNITVAINIDQMVTILCGNSGTGKTYIVDSLRIIKSTPGLIKYSGFDPDNVLIIDRESEINQIGQDKIKGKLIIVDRADRLQADTNEKLNELINKCQNTWILMKRINKESIKSDKRNQNKFNSDVNFTRYGYKQLVVQKDITGNILIQDELV